MRLIAKVWLLPNYCGYGIGGHLLHLAEIRAQERVAAAPPGARVTVGTSWVSERNQRAQQLLEHAGYQKVYSFAHMELDLDELPSAPIWSDGIVVRPFRPQEDKRASYEADEEISKDERGHVPLTFEEWQQRNISDSTFMFLPVLC